jgi:hypothetical protein
MPDTRTSNVNLPHDQTIYILSKRELLSAWLKDRVDAGRISPAEARRLWNDWNAVPANAANYFAVGQDLQLFHKLAKDLGSLTAQYYVKEYGGKLHIVLKGNPRLRQILTGTKYGITNPKVVSMGLGRLGAMKSVRGGGIVTAVLLTAYNIGNYVLSDNRSLSVLIGAIAVDVAKVAVSTAASAIAVGMVASAGPVGVAFALGPLGVAIVVGFLVGLGLDYLDNRYKLKERLSTMLADVADDVSRRAEAVGDGMIETAQTAVRTAIAGVVDLVVDEMGRQFRRFVSRNLGDLRWFPMPRL